MSDKNNYEVSIEESFLNEYSNIGVYNTEHERNEYTQDEVVKLLHIYSSPQAQALREESNARLLEIMELNEKLEQSNEKIKEIKDGCRQLMISYNQRIEEINNQKTIIKNYQKFIAKIIELNKYAKELLT